ncbi:hypothetical protein [Geoalkalibacter halelectricus]|uniref:Tetratricopeptide repeat protein n=1 Tax=Geoalkalibacter halelectricus TaxID=2847045 RepID=A0ABY5ZTA9_9BACT|nr:hypothetical protein [Geoalkalibacter halelectricus]MDO3376921.1 hypothetical protein [Geoalkalibacter halelectricus]UWZ81145.1 hypothetical protein L9S41_07045 [Geoalkalibacter halelectricus]
MKWVSVLLLCLVLATGLGGCVAIHEHLSGWMAETEAEAEPVAEIAEEPFAEISEPLPPRRLEARDVLDFLAAFQDMDADLQAEEYLRLARRYETNPEDKERLQLAAVMLIPGRGFSNAHRGRELLQEHLKNSPGSEDLDALARLLIGLVAEREKVETLLARERQNSETLARQLNELRNIETIMRQREVNGRPGL